MAIFCWNKFFKDRHILLHRHPPPPPRPIKSPTESNSQVAHTLSNFYDPGYLHNSKGILELVKGLANYKLLSL